MARLSKPWLFLAEARSFTGEGRFEPGAQGNTLPLNYDLLPMDFKYCSIYKSILDNEKAKIIGLQFRFYLHVEERRGIPSLPSVKKQHFIKVL